MIPTASISVPWLLRNVSLSKSTQFDCARVPVEERSTASQGILGDSGITAVAGGGSSQQCEPFHTRSTWRGADSSGCDKPQNREGVGHRTPRLPCWSTLTTIQHVSRVTTNALKLKHVERLARRNVASCPPGGVEGGGARVGPKESSRDLHSPKLRKPRQAGTMACEQNGVDKEEFMQAFFEWYMQKTRREVP